MVDDEESQPARERPLRRISTFKIDVDHVEEDRSENNTPRKTDDGPGWSGLMRKASMRHRSSV